MYQYNRTKKALEFFDYRWDFAVPRQGYVDYSFKAFSKAECDRRQHWILFKATNQAVLSRLLCLAGR